MVLNTNDHVVALAGGVGGAKLVYGLSKILPPQRLTIIGNVGDDFALYGLHISPDLDTVMYTLAEVANPATGWGVADDTGHMLAMLERYGAEPWFRLGDRDLATHLLRSQWLAEGVSLTEVTRRLLAGLGVDYPLLPATDDPLATMVDTVEHGTLAFQDYFVRRRWQPVVERVWFQGADRARITQLAAAALQEAAVVVICPSNPVLSIDPILAVQEVRPALAQRSGVCVAVSPFVGGEAIKGPAAKLMRELALDITPRGVAQHYAGIVDGLVIDVQDQDQPLAKDMPVLATSTWMKTDEDKVRLAEQILEWVGSVKR
jgi:LPPG:FO 2-phospho-L-lactate transferase